MIHPQRLVLSISFFIWSNASFAQAINPNLFEVCKTVFVDGSRDIYSYSNDTERARSYLDAICNIEASTYQEFEKKSQDLNSSGDTIWGLFKLKAHGDSDYKQFKDEFKLACSRLSDESYLRSITNRNSSRINGSLGNVFNMCIKSIGEYAKTQNYTVFQSWKFQSQQGRLFSVYVTFAGGRKEDNLTITSISPDFVTCRYAGENIKPVFSKPYILKSQNTVAEFPLDCERPANEQITFTLAADGMSTNKIDIPEWKDQIPELRSRNDALGAELDKLKEEVVTLNANMRSAFNTQLGRLNTESPNGYIFTNTEPANNGGGNNPDASPGRCPVGSYVVGIQPFKDTARGADGSGIRSIVFRCAPLPSLSVQ